MPSTILDLIMYGCYFTLAFAERDSFTTDDGRFFWMTGNSKVNRLAWLTESISQFLVSNSTVERSKSTAHPVGLRLAILFIALSAAVGFFASIVSLREPFPVTGHLMGATDFTAPNGLLKCALGLISTFLCTVPLLYSGIAIAFNFTNTATSITLAFASALFGVAGWGLYRFQNWARLLTVTISIFTFLPILGSFPPFFVDSFTAMTAFLPFVVPYGLMAFYFRRDDVRRLFG